MEDVSIQARSHHLAIGRQWKSRSVLLLPHFYKEKPPPVAPGPVVQHHGSLMQLSSKVLLVPGSWKQRYCVLDGRRLYFYQLKEGNQGLHHYRDKTSHYVDLDVYDICEEAKGIKTASNVLVISSSEIEKSFFETGRFYLSAMSTKEMNEWISHIRTAMTDLRDKGKSSSSTSSSPVKKKPNNPAASAAPPSTDNSTTTSSTNNETAKSAVIPLSSLDTVIPRDATEHLNCITKQRPKGPTGRRQPGATKSRMYPSDHNHLQVDQHDTPQVVQQQRSESLPRLEQQQTDPVIRLTRKPTGRRQHLHQLQQHNRSFDTSHFQQLQKRAAAATVYAYSSSDDDESVNLSLGHQGRHHHQLLQQHDDETVETLCELPLIHHSTSTPSLAVQHPSLAQLSNNNHWLSVGSSSSTPRPVTGKRRSALQPYSCGSTSTDDDPPGLQHQYQLLLQHTAAIKTQLSGLEAEFGASRRDMGWLQENLTTVQSAAGSVSDKVNKMQSQVANMERQINGAVKEAQQMQQRANEALKSASDAERDFRRLESDCQSLLSQLRHQHLQHQQQQHHSDTLDDALCLSPMTPHPPGVMMMSFQQLQQQQQQNQGLGTDTIDHHFSTQRASSRLPPLAPVPQLNVPPSFDFAALLTKSIPIGASATETAPRIKSSFRSEGVNKSGAKSISFGPTTTYATSPTTEPDDDILPAATSTLRKTISHNSVPSFVLPASDFNQNSPQHSMAAIKGLD